MNTIIENLRISIIQPDIIWEKPEENLEKYAEWIEYSEKTDVIILPEMFTTGFSMKPQKLMEPMGGVSVKWMKDIAAQKKAAVVGSIIIEENGEVFNRAIWVFPHGKVEFYDKRHLYTMGEEHVHYSPGKKKTIIEYNGWKFCPQICYDLRFPVFARNLENYDVLFYMANWPAPRHHVWKKLLTARAIENQSYCFGVNRVGVDGIGIKYLGDSVFVSPKGSTEFLGSNELVKTFEITYSELHSFRNKFPLLNDKDNFKIID